MAKLKRKNNRQHNGQNKKDNMTDNDPQIMTHKTIRPTFVKCSYQA